MMPRAPATSSMRLAQYAVFFQLFGATANVSPQREARVRFVRSLR
jgi:hypothetical protein